MVFVLTGSPQTLPLGDAYLGAEVTVLTDVPLVVSQDIGRFVALFGQAVDQSRPDIQVKALRAAWTLFTVDVGVGWNVHDHRGRVPLDEAFGRVPDGLLVHVLSLWADAMTGDLPEEGSASARVPRRPKPGSDAGAAEAGVPAEESPTELVRVERAE